MLTASVQLRDGSCHKAHISLCLATKPLMKSVCRPLSFPPGRLQSGKVESRGERSQKEGSEMADAGFLCSVSESKFKFLACLRSINTWRWSVKISTSEGTVMLYAVPAPDPRFTPSLTYTLTAKVIYSLGLGNKTLPFQIRGRWLMEQALLDVFCSYTGIA